uniref:Uncharacterized protein n=1 Tax=Caenorhabditis japonica TaxID=281687 RepID=A0A8R1I3G3_CAEJA
MSEFHQIVRASKSRRPDKKPERTYTWEKHLHAFEKDKTSFVPVEAFNVNLLVDCNDSVREGVIFETVVHDYDKSCDGVQTRWFARVEKVCGYRVLAQFIGSESKFWINFLSEDVYSLANATRTNPELDKFVYAPPLPLNKEYQNDMVNFINNSIDCEITGQIALAPVYDQAKVVLYTPRFRVGQRLELLNYTKSTEIRVARVQATCGRRLNVLVMKKDFPGSLPDAEDDRQVFHHGAQYWIDEGSFFIFPVGFAAVNGYKLNARKDYIDHTRKIAEAIKKGKEPHYDPEDVTFDHLPKPEVDPELWKQVKKGQKFELIDPLAQQFKNLHVASILDFLTTDGYMIVGMDGPDALEDSFPIHINNAFMFPVGYAEQNNLELVNPDGFEGDFVWDKYLSDENADKLPIEVFKPLPSKERLDKFQVGMRLEAADMCENQFICPATITSVHGRLINVNFDGWDDEFDELYDIDSHDILPIGWCEVHDYTLQEPKKPED